jgi:hypothetical protein
MASSSPNQKIAKHSDKFVLFYSKWCGYSVKALKRLQESRVPHRAYVIDDISSNIGPLLEHLQEGATVHGFPKSHKTRPIIFRNGVYFGDSDKLMKTPI